eukprot:TRINITY_DN34838_c0_g1_i1.p1 TRINITY_DN34838_c0_g1~~TRINITY_DN34838_c0_g1_i1.p1  ORF type:complete len:1032 (-),score=288.30 TRINITY_DN34838_c0_g1_i1:211-3306(-)
MAQVLQQRRRGVRRPILAPPRGAVQRVALSEQQKLATTLQEDADARAVATSLFMRMDADGDGRLSCHELRRARKALRRALGYCCQQQQWDALLMSQPRLAKDMLLRLGLKRRVRTARAATATPAFSSSSGSDRSASPERCQSSLSAASTSGSTSEPSLTPGQWQDLCRWLYEAVGRMFFLDLGLTWSNELRRQVHSRPLTCSTPVHWSRCSGQERSLWSPCAKFFGNDPPVHSLSTPTSPTCYSPLPPCGSPMGWSTKRRGASPNMEAAATSSDLQEEPYPGEAAFDAEVAVATKRRTSFIKSKLELQSRRRTWKPGMKTATMRWYEVLSSPAPASGPSPMDNSEADGEASDNFSDGLSEDGDSVPNRRQLESQGEQTTEFEHREAELISQLLETRVEKNKASKGKALQVPRPPPASRSRMGCCAARLRKHSWRVDMHGLRLGTQGLYDADQKLEEAKQAVQEEEVRRMSRELTATEKKFCATVRVLMQVSRNFQAATQGRQKTLERLKEYTENDGTLQWNESELRFEKEEAKQTGKLLLPAGQARKGSKTRAVEARLVERGAIHPLPTLEDIWGLLTWREDMGAYSTILVVNEFTRVFKYAKATGLQTGLCVSGVEALWWSRCSQLPVAASCMDLSIDAVTALCNLIVTDRGRMRDVEDLQVSLSSDGYGVDCLQVAANSELLLKDFKRLMEVICELMGVGMDYLLVHFAWCLTGHFELTQDMCELLVTKVVKTEEQIAVADSAFHQKALVHKLNAMLKGRKQTGKQAAAAAENKFDKVASIKDELTRIRGKLENMQETGFEGRRFAALIDLPDLMQHIGHLDALAEEDGDSSESSESSPFAAEPDTGEEDSDVHLKTLLKCVTRQNARRRSERKHVYSAADIVKVSNPNRRLTRYEFERLVYKSRVHQRPPTFSLGQVFDTTMRLMSDSMQARAKVRKYTGKVLSSGADKAAIAEIRGRTEIAVALQQLHEEQFKEFTYDSPMMMCLSMLGFGSDAEADQLPVRRRSLWAKAANATMLVQKLRTNKTNK